MVQYCTTITSPATGTPQIAERDNEPYLPTMQNIIDRITDAVERAAEFNNRTPFDGRLASYRERRQQAESVDHWRDCSDAACCLNRFRLPGKYLRSSCGPKPCSSQVATNVTELQRPMRVATIVRYAI